MSDKPMNYLNFPSDRQMSTEVGNGNGNILEIVMVMVTVIKNAKNCSNSATDR